MELVRRDRDGGEPAVIEGGLAPTGGVAFSPDGGKMVFSTCKSSAYLTRITAEGKVVPLTRQGGWKDDFPIGLGETSLLLDQRPLAPT